MVLICVYVWKITTNNKETRQLFDKKRKYNQEVYQLLIDLKKTYILVRKFILFNIVIIVKTKF